jgi:prephenate dehydrogenase
MDPAFSQLTVLAPGLLGGSLAVGARERGLAKKINVWARREEVRAKCRATGWFDGVFDTPEESVRGSDLVVICTPVETIHRLARRIAGSLSAGAIVTDVGSTKGQLCRLTEAIMPEGTFFVGSHPMAGSEKSGLDFAKGDLFAGRTCFVTPLEATDAAAAARVGAFWKALGMEIVSLSPDEHDEIVANISHLPHYVATIICNWLSHNDPKWKDWAGPGLCDTTRVAAGSPDMWRAISEENKTQILRSLDGFQKELDRMRGALVNDRYDELHQLFTNAKAFRESLCSAKKDCRPC